MKTVSVLVATAFLAGASVAVAAEPTQKDFDACNRIAQSKVKPSQSASPKSPADTTARSRPTTDSPQAAPSPKPAGEARVANQADQLRGIADASKDDPAYQQAYLDCMKGRGF
jgi:hypothetical protein